ncbi:imidazole glycerol phosphate synthase subunit HisH [Sneathiella sp. HT1-7]|jgi:glutamine amidotransferase|uniref:imidazole glycerol phosphate synthase subunit HisH n=1 Tax=Sneathiella sp. HT1-7 TaxID=2887192 RepID=UPI001D13D14C|nr:imidazole glycerol phosphate synthase subunit HisH [Sneathiella sp. HT1-7]MCC3304066.1 imidazole glycerol phosphate synthase subunit HisH [Sneathiella sp. HT1-7]
METVIIDYGSGNLRSAAKAFERACRESNLSIKINVTSDANEVAAADRIVLPGVGAFRACKNGLLALDGMADALQEAVIEKGRPFFGICVGMQLMASQGIEHGTTEGLGWIGGDVVNLAPDDPGLKIPHMGWNELQVQAAHPLFDGIASGQHVYFVHSYHLAAHDPDHILATVDYGGPVTAIVGRDNMIGTQFHPEKSQETGLRLIANFLRWNP